MKRLNKALDINISCSKRMIDSLNSIGWEKVIINFDGALPLAHNKICAHGRYPATLSKLLGFDDGMFVMQNLAKYIFD
jgi:hypothetical protein